MVTRLLLRHSFVSIGLPTTHLRVVLSLSLSLSLFSSSLSLYPGNLRRFSTGEQVVILARSRAESFPNRREGGGGGVRGDF